MSAGGGSRAPALRLTQESAGSPESNVSDNFPLHRQGTRTTKVSLYLASSFNMIYAFFVQGIVGFFPTVNNMEMLKIAIFQRVSTNAHQGDLAGLSRWRLGSPKRGERRGRGRGLSGFGSGAGARGRGRFKGRRGGGGEGRPLSPSGGGRVTWARGAAAIGPRHVSRRPARDVTRGGSVKNKNKNPE